ncbi:MAG: TnsA endonuclease N-terminal domain-containing protein [Candidatus Ornithospirochaeta sp.]
MKLRWNDDVLDIREQFLLDPSRIESIATSMGTRPAQNGKVLMSTDFLVDTTKGQIAVCVKDSRKTIEKATKRMLLLLEMEKRYWDSLGIPWKLVFKEDLNRIEVANIKDVVRFYDRKNVFDDYSLAKHLIATKRIIVNMKEEIDYLKLISELKKESIWEEYTKE